MDMNSYLEVIKKKAKEAMHHRKLNHYYLQKTTEGKSYFAMLFDAILVKLVVLFALLVFFYIRTLDLVFSSIITLQFLVLYMLISYRIKRLRMRKVIERVNDQIVKKRIYKDLINKTPFEFIEIMKSNLEKCSFNKLQLVNQRDLDLVGELKDKKVGIKCFQFSKDYNVGINIIRDFFLTLRDQELDEGVIITTSSFSEGVKDFLLKLKDHKIIYIIDIDRIIKIMKKANTYPSQKEVEKMILNQIADQKKKLTEYKDTVISKKKFAKYFIIATAIFLFGRITPYQQYYQIIAGILYTLGVISTGNYVVNLLKSNTKDKTEEIF